MALIVKKYGGSSIENIELIDNLAKKLANEKKSGDDIVVVVSAMAKTTDELFTLARQLSDNPYQRELDMLVTAGERISMALLSIALHKYGTPAISFTGSQSGIITDNSHGNARIVNVNAFRIKEELEKGKIVIVAGFQGVSLNKEITTLGRGGSDTTAVALAGFLNADICQINKDVDGIYSADPHIVSKVKKYEEISYETMLFLSYNGCKAIHPRAVEFAMKYNIPIEVKSSFNDNQGTIIHKEAKMKEKDIVAITGREGLVVYDIFHSTDNEESEMAKSHFDNNVTLSVIDIMKNNLLCLLEFEIIDKEHIRFVTASSEQHKIDKAFAEKEVIMFKGVSSLSFALCNCNEEMTLISEVLSILNREEVEVLWLTKNHQGFTLYIKDAVSSDIIKRLHEILIEN